MERTIRMTFRAINETPLPLDALSMEPEIVQAVEDLDKGIIFFVGPTGTGKSASMASLLEHKLTMPNAEMNLVTLEAPIEAVFKNERYKSSIAFQMEVGRTIRTNTAGLDNMLRMKPTHMMIGEARADEEIETAIKAARSGHGRNDHCSC